jgi:shikimate 5-dehydrogenase
MYQEAQDLDATRWYILEGFAVESAGSYSGVTIMSGMKILVIGSGGREHALAWKLRQSPTAEAAVTSSESRSAGRSPKCCQ